MCIKILGIIILFNLATTISCSTIISQKEECNLSTGFENQFICAYMILNDTNSAQKQCILEAFYRGSYSTIILMKFDDILTRNVLQKPRIINCNTYIILIQDVKFLRVVFSHVGGHGRFYPFTNIMVIFALDERYEQIFNYDQGIFGYITSNSLNVVWTHYQDFVNDTQNIEFHRVLSNELIFIHPKIQNSSKQDHRFNQIRIFDENKLIDELIKNRHRLMNIRVSFFKCAPFIYYIKKGNQTTFDGIEWRFFNETTRNWKRQYFQRDISKEILDPWERSLQDLKDDVSDMSMCSIWLTEEHHTKFELSKEYDQLCYTFVVPKPTVIAPTYLIYLSLDYHVWAVFLITILLCTVVLKLLSAAGKKLMNDKNYGSQYNYPILAILDMINIVTSHGSTRFPIHLPIKVMIICWTFFSLLFGTGYSTGYTSLLTSPRYSKPIETISDFLEQQIEYGEPMENPKVKTTLMNTGNPQYIELAKRIRKEESFEYIYKRMGSPKYGRLLKVLSNSFATETEGYIDRSRSLQTMSQCIFHYFTVFAFQKQTPFRKIIDRQIPRYLESGIHQKWFLDLVRLYDSRMQFFFDKSFTRKTHAQPLSIINLVGVFYLLVSGLGIAIIVFILELFVHWKRELFKTNAEVITMTIFKEE